MRTNEEIFKQFSEKIIPELQAVSKRFADSITSEIDDTSIEITASPLIRTLIDGRGPTGIVYKPSTPNLQKLILKWIKEKGITDKSTNNGKVKTSEALSWAISQSIHKKGDLLFQRGGGNNIFDPILTPQRIENLLNLLTVQYISKIQNIVK